MFAGVDFGCRLFRNNISGVGRATRRAHHIYAGDSAGPGNGTIIGNWEVIDVPEPTPEPTTLVLAGLGGLSLLLFRRRQ